jgi:hypothetical protein
LTLCPAARIISTMWSPDGCASSPADGLWISVILMCLFPYE